MFTLILAAVEAFGQAEFGALYVGTFILDVILIEGLVTKVFN